MASDSPSVLSAALLISGTSLGAGLLALPIQTGLAGLAPALVGLVVMWGLMLVSGMILVQAVLASGQEGTGLFTLFDTGVGRWSRWLVTPTFILIFYGLLVAYLSGSGSVLSALLHLERAEKGLLLLFFLLSSATVLVGLRFVHRANVAFMLLLILSFGAMLVLTASQVKGENMLHRDWHFLPSALPIILCSFAFQNIIPSICDSLGHDRGRIHRALFFGTLLTLLINGAWVVAVVGSLPIEGGGDSLLDAFQKNQPATVPLAANLHSRAIGFCSLLFSMAALFTSYVAVGEGLRNFLTDLLGSRGRDAGRGKVALLTFVPPLIVSLLYPQLFLKMLNLVGGLGVVLLFGLLPALLLFRQAKGGSRGVQRFLALVLGLVFFTLLLLECGQEMGLLQIHPDVEYWHGGQVGSQ